MRQLIALLATSATLLTHAGADTTSNNIDAIISQVPQCAYACLGEASTSTGCGLSDLACMCDNLPKLLAAANPCISSNCPADDVAKILSIANGVCKGIGAPSPAATSETTAGNGTLPAATTGVIPSSQIAAASSSGVNLVVVVVSAAVAVILA